MPKKREPVRRIFTVDDRTYELSVESPTWRNRALVAAMDHERGYNGRAVDALERHFGDAWLQQQCDAAHPVAAMMALEHELYVPSLLDVADLLICAEGQAFDLRETDNRLRSVEEYESAETELRVARLLHSWKQRVRPVPRSQDRGHDLDCIDADVAVEVKRMESAERSDFETALTNLVMDPILDHLGFDVGFWWAGARVEEAWREKVSRVALMNAIAADVVPPLARALRDGGSEVVVDETVVIRIQSSGDPETGEYGAFGDDVRAAQRTSKRWEKALRQLPNDRTGLVFLCGDYHTIAVEETRRAAVDWMERGGHDTAHIAATVLLLVRSGVHQTVEEIWPLRNPSAEECHALRSWAWLDTPIGWLR